MQVGTSKWVFLHEHFVKRLQVNYLLHENIEFLQIYSHY